MNGTGRPLDDSLREVIEARLHGLREPLGEYSPSEWSFDNLYLFRRARNWRFADTPLPHLRGRGYDGSVQLIALCELGQADKEALRDLQGEDGWFCPIPEASLERLDPTAFEWHTMRDDADYLYHAASFREYTGVGLGSKRAAVERLRARLSLQVRDLDVSARKMAMDVLEGWCRDKGSQGDGADAMECREALNMLGQSATNQNLFGYLHLADDTPAGFVLCEEINPSVVVVRFSKGLQRFDGIFPIMYQHLARQTDRIIRWINFEQDLGRGNFRRSKLSFHPARLLYKYRVRVRS